MIRIRLIAIVVAALFLSVVLATSHAPVSMAQADPPLPQPTHQPYVPVCVTTIGMTEPGAAQECRPQPFGSPGPA
jgi:hypothetical protein